MDRTKAALIGTAVIAAVIVLFVVASVYWQIHSSGRIKTVNIGVYSDQACTITVGSIEWGSLSPGSQAEAKVYFKNTGNSPINVTMITEAWVPAEAEVYITLGWNYPGGELQPGQIQLVILTLTISPSISGITDFTFDIIITGTG